ncbi:MAG: chromosome segregation protein SMC [Ruminococcus sp.]|nr:chromosome segregation protein SMC [Ruminococcus sp.]
MYLRSLELQGFKSFPDKTKLEFTKGISAVVGPNGSGKSNIGDAMRWVLGEKSWKSLRGEKMEDVIFYGSVTRPKANFAQVTLTIDNCDHALKNDADIVSVSRKLYRNGDSEYMLNGSNVRLKDIEELFMDTGLGKDGYAIIGQGKIGEIVSSKSTDRRMIFDEAAGISKFRSKKRETENELARAEDNISRLTDILSELEGRLTPLKKQCEKAKRFRVLDDEKRGLEVSLWVMRLNELMDKSTEYEHRLSLLKDQYEALSNELEQIEKEIENEFAKAAKQGEIAAELKENIHQIELEKSNSGAKTAVLENDIKHLEEKIEQINDSIDQSRSSAYFLQNQLEQKQSELQQRIAEGEALEMSIDELEGRLKGSQNEQSAREGELDRLEREINELYLEKSNATFKLESAKNLDFTARQSLEELALDRAEREDRRRLFESEKDKIVKKSQQLKGQKQELENKSVGYSKLWEGKQKKLESAQQTYSDNENELKGIAQRLGILRDLENAMEGFAYSVKYIMKASSSGMLSGVFGSVAQLIEVPSKYSTAVETALGGALQNIAVRDEAAAKRCIRLLKDNKAGRATFLPLTSVKARTLENPPVGEEGFIALASELVESDEKFTGLVKNLLGRTAVAEDIDSASEIAKRHGYKFKIVTLDGQVVNAGGSYTGGSTSKSTGILTRKNEISELESKQQKLDGKRDELRHTRESLMQEVQNLSAQLDGVKENLSGVGEDILRSDMELKRVEQMIDELDGGEQKLNESIEKYNDQINQAEQQTNEASEQLSRLEKDISQREEKRTKLSDENTRRLDEGARLSAELSEMRVKSAENQKDIDAVRSEIERLNTSISEGSGDEQRFYKEIDACKGEIDKKHEEILAIAESVSDSGERTKALEKKIELAQAEQVRINLNAEKQRQEQKNKMNERETLAEEVTRLTERTTSVTQEFDKLTGQLWDEYGLTRTEAGESYPEPEDAKESRMRLNELRAQIKSLGNVNLGAIEEYEEVSQRYEFMSSQLEDVNKSKLELCQLIDSLTESMKSIFTESFEKINKSFSEIFTELFGGGKASLSLTDEDNVLESGIEINAAPPGKVGKSLMSLSGGEIAFVAVCIYFAILTVRPSPFCLLDEIEAALDDVNVSKYAAYLHKFTDKTQFIAITHRRGTMEEADVLYGVTMQEKGVSRLLKMSMEDTKSLEAGEQ